MPRNRKPATPTGLARRKGRAYYRRAMPKAVGGDRVYRSLEADYGSDLATARVNAINTLWDRGDWPILRRWAAGEVHISDIVRATRDGDWTRLKRVRAEGYRLQDAVDAHLKRTRATRRPSTIRTHESVCDALIAAFEPDRALHTVTKADAEAFLHAPKPSNRDQPWSSNTATLNKQVAGAVWALAMETEAEEAERTGAVPTVTRNPWSRAAVFRERKVRPAVLTAEERDDLLAHPKIQGTPERTLVALAFLAGLRQQEIAHLRTSVDVELLPPEEWTPLLAGYLHIQSRKGDRPWDTKTDNSDRRVPIVPRLGRILLDHMERGYAGRTYLIRPARRDHPISADTAGRWTEKAYTAAGIRYGRNEGDGMTLHHGRHTYATILLSSGVSIAVVAELMGDTQETVLKSYSHCLPHDRELALSILEGLK